jgi:hypothetical protein
MNKLLLALVFVSVCSPCSASVNFEKIQMIESSLNPDAVGDQGRSIGIYQISKGLLQDFCRATGKDYRHVEMRSPDQAQEVAEWAFNSYFPKILKGLGKDITEQNLIVCFNAGCGVLKGKIPKSTREYLSRYRRLS